LKKVYLGLIILFSLIVGSVAGIYVFHVQDKPLFGSSPNNSAIVFQHAVNQTNPEESVQVAQQAVAFIPSRLIVPKLKINTEVEHVGVDKNQNMDVPKQAMNVAWYKLGYKPGEIGNAVLAGHYDRKNGSPAIFYNLSKLSIGDTFSVVSQDGREQKYKVTGRRTYNTDAFPIEQVFGGHSKPRLNLITCSGEWNRNAQSYTKRTVVFSELVSS
jgi:sortase A